jgi:hypothetical protein
MITEFDDFIHSIILGGTSVCRTCLISHVDGFVELDDLNLLLGVVAARAGLVQTSNSKET